MLEPVAESLGYARETRSRRALEALLVDECAGGWLSRGKFADILGLSFHEAEDLLRARRVPYPIKSIKDDALDSASLAPSRPTPIAFAPPCRHRSPYPVHGLRLHRSARRLDKASAYCADDDWRVHTPGREPRTGVSHEEVSAPANLHFS